MTDKPLAATSSGRGHGLGTAEGDPDAAKTTAARPDSHWIIRVGGIALVALAMFHILPWWVSLIAVALIIDGLVQLERSLR
ncbi:MAG TPA: hypothetical protein VMU39_01475 [Solirubrobacteraceae bacterium]|nr:hypothetical protein [Solirubrobacteraceae bacterium]